MSRLYSKCFEINNLRNAIRNVLNSSGSKTAGPDGISKFSKIKEERYIKEIKLRLRRFKKVNSKIVEIPKKGSETRKLTVINLFDRMAQQAVYQVIKPIVEMNFNENSYGFRQGINAKVPVSKLASFIQMNRNVYTIEIDFTKCFDNIPLEKALDMLRLLGVKDAKLIKTIKHLMYVSKEYKGVGLGQGTILGPILANCYLTKLDEWVCRNVNLGKWQSRARDYRKHKHEWEEWLMRVGRKPHGKYYRYADDSIMVFATSVERDIVYREIKEYIDQELDITINETKTKLNKNHMNFLGFHLYRDNCKTGAGIRIDKLKDYVKEANKYRFMSNNETEHFIKWLRGVLQYFDIINDAGPLLSKIGLRLLIRSRRKGCHLKQRKGKVIYDYEFAGKHYIIDIFDMRKATKLSVKDYNQNGAWLRRREAIKKIWYENYTYAIWIYDLFTRQRGIDPISKEPIKLGKYEHEIHHIRPRSKGGKDELSNMILVNKETHQEIHNSDSKRTERYRRYIR